MRWLPEELKPNIVSLSLRPGGEKDIRKETPLILEKIKVKLSLFTANIVVYIESLMESIKKLLELICGFYKVSGYKINIKNHISLHKQWTKAILKQFIYNSIKIIYLGIHLTKNVKDLYILKKKHYEEKLKKT